MATLTREVVTMKWAAAYRRLMLPPNSTETLLSGMTFDHARNTAVESMLKSGFEWIFFLDDDVVCPPDTIHRLLAHQKDIVSGVYYRRAFLPGQKAGDQMAPVMLRYKSELDAEWIVQYPQALFEVDLVGAGCLLVHRRVFERMIPEPLPNRPRAWFRWELDKDVPEPRHSEDFSWARDAKRKFGFQIWVDGTIQCEHIGHGSSSVAGYQPASL